MQVIDYDEAWDQEVGVNETGVVISINPLSDEQISELPQGVGIISFIEEQKNPGLVDLLVDQRATVCALEKVPRTTAAQYMDTLTSTAKVAGFKAVQEGIRATGRFPMSTATAGYQVKPATVFVIGVGVAGLEAISVAKTQGANVKAFDPRPEVKDQVTSLGAEWVDMGITVEEIGGYASDLQAEFLRQEQMVIARELQDTDLVITSAAIPNKPPPCPNYRRSS
ncbi:hypothetical protein GEMRC1_005418 [Eukaryota sp. GEM-RC1]